MKMFHKKRIFLKFLFGSVLSIIFFKKKKLIDKNVIVFKREDSVTWILNKNDI